MDGKQSKLSCLLVVNLTNEYTKFILQAETGKESLPLVSQDVVYKCKTDEGTVT